MRITTDKALLRTLQRTPGTAGAPPTPLHFAVTLLRALRRDEQQYFQAFGQRPDRSDRDRLIADIANLLPQTFGGSVYVTDPDFTAIETWIRIHGQLHAPIKARLIAKAIEQRYRQSFPDLLQRYYAGSKDPDDPDSLLVGPGDPVPVFHSIFGMQARGDPTNHGMTTSPRSLPRWRSPDRLGTILLAPQWVEQVDLRLNFALSDDMRLLDQSPVRIATIHPSSTTLQDAYAWDHDGEHFWGVRPNDPVTIRRRIMTGIKRAAREGAKIMVLPELCAREEDQADIEAAWRSVVDLANPYAPLILIAGSYHERTENGTWRNVSRVYTASGRTSVVTKAVPYVYSQSGNLDRSRATNLLEKIEFNSRPRIEIFCSDNMTMMIFICVDFLLDRLRDLARDLDISLLVIPSMSQKSQVFHGLMDGHVAATQATALFSNVILSTDESAWGYLATPSVPPLFGQLIDDSFGSRSGSATKGSGVAILDLAEPVHSKWVAIK